MVDLTVEIGGVKFKNPVVVGSATPTMDSIRMRHGIDGGLVLLLQNRSSGRLEGLAVSSRVQDIN